MTTFYPVFLNLQSRPCAVIGGGAVAEQKVFGLLEAGASVTVVSPQVTQRLDELAAQGTIALKRRSYCQGDLERMFLAIAASEDRGGNREIKREAEQRGILLNAVDDLPHCNFIAPAIHRQGDLTLAISTAGKSPALAVRLRDRFAAQLGRDYATFLDLLGELRAEVATRIPELAARTSVWYQIVDSDAIEFIRRGDIAGARQRIADLIDAAVRRPEGAESPQITEPSVPPLQRNGRAVLAAGGEPTC